MSQSNQTIENVDKLQGGSFGAICMHIVNDRDYSPMLKLIFELSNTDISPRVGDNRIVKITDVVQYSSYAYDAPYCDMADTDVYCIIKMYSKTNGVFFGTFHLHIQHGDWGSKSDHCDFDNPCDWIVDSAYFSETYDDTRQMYLSHTTSDYLLAKNTICNDSNCNDRNTVHYLLNTSTILPLFRNATESQRDNFLYGLEDMNLLDLNTVAELFLGCVECQRDELLSEFSQLMTDEFTDRCLVYRKKAYHRLFAQQRVAFDTMMTTLTPVSVQWNMLSMMQSLMRDEEFGRVCLTNYHKSESMRINVDAQKCARVENDRKNTSEQKYRKKMQKG